MKQHEIVLVAPAALRPRTTNPRTHSKKQIRQIADSIERFGFTNPILVDRDNGIIAGHGRVEAAKLLQLNSVPILRLEDMSREEIRAYVIADNKLAENAGWDRQLLALELQGLLEVDLDFEVTITGFDMPEIDILIGELECPGEAPYPDDDAAAVEPGSAVTRPGDLWHIGKHRLLCGDSTDPQSYARLLGGEKAGMVFTDPPYNVAVDGHVCGLGKVKHREFAMASGEMSEAEFTAFLQTVFTNLAAASVDGAIHFICMDWRHLGEALAAGKAAFSEMKNLCVWAKTNAGMGSLYRSQHELVFVFKSASGPHINNVELGRHGRYRTNLWTYPGNNSFGHGRDEALADHPTVKPVALVADAILDCSRRGSIVLDAFAGSGTTLVAAQRTGRRGFGIELDPAYCDAALQRLRRAGLTPVHGETGQGFDQLAAERSPGDGDGGYHEETGAPKELA